MDLFELEIKLPVLPLAFIIGDALSSDQLCGHYKNYSPNVTWLS